MCCLLQSLLVCLSLNRAFVARPGEAARAAASCLVWPRVPVFCHFSPKAVHGHARGRAAADRARAAVAWCCRITRGMHASLSGCAPSSIGGEGCFLACVVVVAVWMQRERFKSTRRNSLSLSPGQSPWALSLSLSVSLARGKLVPATHARTSALALALHAHTHGARTHARLASVARTLCPPARPPARDIGRLSHRLQVQGGRRAPDTAGAGARQLYFGCGFGTAASV